MREEDSHSGYVPRWRRRHNNEDNDIASSSNASSMTDLHVTRKDSSASDASNDHSAACKLTQENLRLHDKLSSQAAPYSSLSRLEERPKLEPTTGATKTYVTPATNDDNTGKYSKYSSRFNR